MFSHVMVGSNDPAAAKLFYDATLGELGYAEGQVDPRGWVFYATPTGLFAVTKPINAEPACCANGGTIGFVAASPEQVDAWHAAGVRHGGTSCEDPPGVRSGPFGQLYAAYLRDPTGHKICAVHRLG